MGRFNTCTELAACINNRRRGRGCGKIGRLEGPKRTGPLRIMRRLHCDVIKAEKGRVQ